MNRGFFGAPCFGAMAWFCNKIWDPVSHVCLMNIRGKVMCIGLLSLMSNIRIYLFIYLFIWREQRKDCFTDDIGMHRSMKFCGKKY